MRILSAVGFPHFAQGVVSLDSVLFITKTLIVGRTRVTDGAF
jgi:hypothetical protein